MTAKWPAFPQVDPLAAEDITDLGNTVLQGDLRSNAWDGGSDLSGGADPDASAGFYIDSSAGVAQFKAIHLTTGAIGTPELADGAVTDVKIDSLSFNKITAATNTASLVIGAGGSIESANFSAGSAGFQITGAGDIEANDATLRGTFQTGTSGKHVSISDASPSLIEFYDGASKKGEVGFFGTTSIRLRSTASNDLFVNAAKELFISAGSAGITVDVGSTTHAMGSQGWLVNGGSAGSPPYSFFGDPNTGMYQITGDEIGFSAGGQRVLGVKANGTGVTELQFAEFNDYLQYDAVNEVFRVFMQSNAEMILSTSAFTVPNVQSNTTGSAANVHCSPSGVLQRSTSARKYKSRTTYNVDYLADIEVNPAKFYRKDSGRWFYGLIADDLADQDPLLVDYDEDGQVENYDDRELLAVAFAKINRLESLVLEAT